MKTGNFKGKVVVITGGTSGIGLACAFAFGNAGAKIVITGRDPLKLAEASASLQSKQIECLPIKADVSIESDCKLTAEQTISKFGRADILVNNAGISMRALFSDALPLVIVRLMQTNFFGTVYASHYFMPEILKNKGSIIGISSIAGFRGLPGRTGYSASKFAMNGFLEALRTELLYSGVHILTVCPGFTASNIRNTALNSRGDAQKESPRDESQMMSAEEVANSILKATFKRKKFLVLTRQGKLTYLLNKFAPFLLDKLVYNVFAKEKDSPLAPK